MPLPGYSARLGSIEPEQFQKALDRFGLGEFVKAEPVSSGLFVQNVFLTSSAGAFIFRGAPHSQGQFPTERFFAHLLHDTTRVPVPFPYWFEPDPGLFGWGYVIMPRLPGKSPHDKLWRAQLTLDDRMGIARAAARTLKEIHSVRCNDCGLYRRETDCVEPFDINYRERTIRTIDEKLNDACSANAHTTPADIRFVHAILKKAEPVLHLPFQPTVVLADFGEHNCVVERAGSDWVVSGVFDLMTAHCGDGVADLSVAVMGYLKENKALADAFVDEYNGHTPAPVAFSQLSQLYMLDATLSFWRYFQKYSGGMPEDETKSLTFEQWARPFIDYWEK